MLFDFIWLWLTIFVLSEGFSCGFSLLSMRMATISRTASRGTVEYARSTAVCMGIAQSCAMEYVDCRKACLCWGYFCTG